MNFRFRFFLLNNTIQFLFDHKKIKQVKQVIVLTKKIASWFMKKFAWYVFDMVVKTKIPLINALIIKKEIILIALLEKIAVSKIMIPLILLFLW